MNRIIVKIFALTVLFSACSKDKRLNKRVNKELEGSWKVTLIDGMLPTIGVKTIWSFNPDKRYGGVINTTITYSPPIFSSYTKTITNNYTIDEKGTLIKEQGSYIYTIIKISKTHLLLNAAYTYNTTRLELTKQ